MIDLFSGIGGFRLIGENYGFNCIAHSEINKNAIKYYQANYNTTQECNLGDITKINKNIINKPIELITAGVPCQSWSIAGKNKGFNDDRGQLWFHTFRMLDIFKPNKFIFENVKGLHDPRNQDALKLIEDNIISRKYHYKILLLNSNDYGSVQIRQRIFIIGFKKQSDLTQFLQNIKKEKKKNPPQLGELLQLNYKKNQGKEKYIFTDVRGGENTIHSWDLIKTTKKEKEICALLLKNRRKKEFGKKDGNPLSLQHFVSLDKTITIHHLEKLVKKKILRKIGRKYDFVNSKISSGINGIYRIYSPISKEFSTITSSNQNDFIALKSWKDKEDFLKNIYQKNNYRKVNTIEMLQIQSFPKEFDLPEKRSAAQKLIGNSVPLNLVDLIIKNLKI